MIDVLKDCKSFKRIRTLQGSAAALFTHKQVCICTQTYTPTTKTHCDKPSDVLQGDLNCFVLLKELHLPIPVPLCPVWPMQCGTKGMQKKVAWEARVFRKFSPSVQTQHFAVRKGWLGEIRLFSRNPLSSLTHGVAGVLAVLLVCLPESHQPASGDASSNFPRAPTFLKGQGTFIFLLFSSFKIQKNFD